MCISSYKKQRGQNKNNNIIKKLIKKYEPVLPQKTKTHE